MSPVTTPLKINKRTIAPLANPSVLMLEDDLPVACTSKCTPWTTDTTHYPQCNPSSYSGCVCGC